MNSLEGNVLKLEYYVRYEPGAPNSVQFRLLGRLVWGVCYHYGILCYYIHRSLVFSFLNIIKNMVGLLKCWSIFRKLSHLYKLYFQK